MKAEGERQKGEPMGTNLRLSCFILQETIHSSSFILHSSSFVL